MPALNTFVTPRPRPGLIRFLGVLNRKFILPRWCRIQAVHMGASAEQRLQQDMASGVPMIFVPNHPEYFTDWMLDKWVLDRIAPNMANWADAGVVNGLGSSMQKFWLGNNLIAAVRGEESAKAIEYSIDWACKGHGVLLHPEGSVNWDNEAVGSLFPGAARMAIEAARRHPSGTAHLAPLAWYLRFQGDVEAELQNELTDLAERLSMILPAGNPAQRLTLMIQALVERVVRSHGLPARSPIMEIYDTRERLLQAVSLVAQVLVPSTWKLDMPMLLAMPPLVQAAFVAKRLRETKLEQAVKAANQLEALAKLDASSLSQTELTQEQIAHRLRRIRQDWVRGKKLDVVARMAPRGVAKRDAHIAVAPRVVVTAQDTPEAVSAKVHAALVSALAEAKEQAARARGQAIAHPIR